MFAIRRLSGKITSMVTYSRTETKSHSNVWQKAATKVTVMHEVCGDIGKIITQS
jgi:hypothetical protein